MRIKIKFNGSDIPLPIQNQHIINSYIHKCLGNNNEYHNTKSDYCISSLQNGKWIEGTDNLSVKNGCYIIVSSIDDSFISKLLLGILNNNFVLYNDIRFNTVEYISESFYDGWNYFNTLSPILLRENITHNKYRFITFEDKEFNNILTQRTINKLKKVNPKLDLSDFKIEIYKGGKHKVKKY
jgi:CRISPR-associated endoribonuclease Cas6